MDVALTPKQVGVLLELRALPSASLTSNQRSQLERLTAREAKQQSPKPSLSPGSVPSKVAAQPAPVAKPAAKPAKPVQTAVQAPAWAPAQAPAQAPAKTTGAQPTPGMAKKKRKRAKDYAAELAAPEGMVSATLPGATASPTPVVTTKEPTPTASDVHTAKPTTGVCREEGRWGKDGDWEYPPDRKLKCSGCSTTFTFTGTEQVCDLHQPLAATCLPVFLLLLLTVYQCQLRHPCSGVVC